jgi:hypothetical protein
MPLVIRGSLLNRTRLGAGTYTKADAARDKEQDLDRRGRFKGVVDS